MSFESNRLVCAVRREGKGVFDLQKANMLKRISAAMLDGILLGILAVGFGFLLSLATGYDAGYTHLKSFYSRYEIEYNISFDITQEAYEALSPERKEIYDRASAALSGDAEAAAALTRVLQLSLTIVTFSLLLACLILEYLVPLLFKNGQTLGKKAFGLAVMRSDAVRLSPLLLLVRTLLGKYTLELMVPVLVIFLFFFGGIGILGPGILCGLALVQVLLLAFTQNHTPLHDLIAHTVVVDYASQMIFDSPEALLRAKEEYHASLARSERY